MAALLVVIPPVPFLLFYAPAAYVWDAYIWLAPLVWIRGWDSYLGGEVNPQLYLDSFSAVSPIAFQTFKL